MKKYLFIIVFFSPLLFLHAEEPYLISVDMDGNENEYNLSSVQTIVVNNVYDAPNFLINFKDGTYSNEGILIKFVKTNPTSILENYITSNVDFNLFVKEHIIYVEAEAECDVMVCTISGQQIMSCYNTLQCSCCIYQPGLYIVFVNDNPIKIHVQ